MKKNLSNVVLSGMRDGLPIGLGYFAVSFSLGIAAYNAGMTVMQGTFMSLLNNASAGEYAGIAAIKANVSLLEVAVLILVTNARYLLMSCALSQKISPETGLFHRLLIGFDITDELFGISIAQKYPLNPYYVYGAYSIALPMWALGTGLGIYVGDILPANVVCALSASIFGMFIAIVIPPAKENKGVLVAVIASFIISTVVYFVPVLNAMSESFRIIILTLVISVVVAILFPRKEEAND
ncbi:MAG: AzlC family ABC transporter permease [Erysipelotrichaceae bacterium]|nr:AzlC family ABC transporter permease [Erysipelotrichaceae bacterium]